MLFRPHSVFKMVYKTQYHYTIGIVFMLCVGGLKGVGSQFLNVPGSVNEIKYGTQNALIYFPENRMGRSSLSVSHNDWYGDFSVISVGIASPIFGGQGLLRFKYGGFENLELRDEVPSDDPLSFYSAFGLDIAGGFQFQFNDIQTAVLLRMVQLRIHTHSSSGLSGNISMLKPINRDWKMGFSLAHFGFMDSYINEEPALPVSGNLLMEHRTVFQEIQNTFSFSGGFIPSLDNYIFSANNAVLWRHLNLSLASHITKNVTHVSGSISFLIGMYQVQYGFQLGDNKLGISQVLELIVLLP